MRSDGNHERKPRPFSMGACLLAFCIHAAGSLLLLGLLFVDGMRAFNNPPPGPSVVQLVTWLWSPLAMGWSYLVGFPPEGIPIVLGFFWSVLVGRWVGYFAASDLEPGN